MVLAGGARGGREETGLKRERERERKKERKKERVVRGGIKKSERKKKIYKPKTH